MNVCSSIAPSSMKEALQKLNEASHQTDIVEIRIDGIKDLNLSTLLQEKKTQIIVTNRKAAEGGKFTGSTKEQISILSEAARLGADYVDIEMSAGLKAINQLRANCRKTKMIVSYHNFERTPSSLTWKYELMKTSNAHILKLATMANHIEDNRIMFDLLVKAKKEKQRLIALCMGETGQISRILQGRFGGYLTYAPLLRGEATAPGQLCVEDLIKIFRVPILDSRTRVFGLIGNPVSHSKGIYFHNNVFAKKGLNIVYVNFLTNDVGIFLDTYIDQFSGFSVTMPFKEKIIPFLDTIEPLAAQLGAVNTVLKRKNKLSACNTDLTAIVKILKKRTALRNKRVTILGTGATAKIMAFAASSQGAKTTIVGRNIEKAQEIAERFGCSSIPPDEIRTLRTDVLMNGTSIGMGTDTNLPMITKKFLTPGMIVFDAVYSPPLTPLLQAAQEKGCETISGLELFQTQAKLQSKMFIESVA